MGDDIEINVTETTNIIEITPQPNDQIVDIAVTDNAPNVEINVTPSVVEINVTRGSSTAIWGSIEGNLTDQSDLVTALGLKADLVDGKVPSTQLPSYVDDVIEVANYAALPTSGEVGKIYVTLDNNKIYRWSGSLYIEIAANQAIWGAITGNLGDQLDLQNALNTKEPTITAGTTSQYWRGDKSWQTLDKNAVGLGNVDNTSDLNKPISTATQTALDLKFNNPTGDTTQYIAGDGSLITFPISGQAGTIVREVRNTTGATLTKGTIVYISGATGNKATISKAIATGDSTSAQTFGLLQADISNNANGYVVVLGDLIGLDTSGITEGSQLYLSSTVAGAYTTTKQVAPAHLVYIGVVTRSHPSLGQIEVKIQNGYELDEIHDVSITSKANNQFLVYESASTLWKNKSLSTILGGTSSQFLKGDGSLDSTAYVPTARTLTINGTAYDLSANRSWTITAGVWGQITGILSDQTDLQTALDAKTPTARTLTINGTAYDLSANRSWTIPTHDAVTIGTPANGLSLSGQILSLGLSSPTTRGALTSEDYNYFFAKIQGDGNQNYIPKYTNSGLGKQIGNSSIFDNGTSVMIGTTGSTGVKVHIVETSTTQGTLLLQNTSASNNATQLQMSLRGTGKLIEGTDATSVLFSVSNGGGGYFKGNLIVGGLSGATSTPTSIIMDGTYRTGGATFDSLKFYLYKSSTETYGIGLGDLADMQYWAGTTSTGAHRFFTSQTERLRIFPNGNTFIGSTPVDSGHKLDVNGVIRGLMPSDPVTGAITAKFLSFSGNPFGLIFRGYDSGTHSIQSQRESSNSEVFPLSLQPLGGNVAINKTSAFSKLEIAGQATSWADSPSVVFSDTAGQADSRRWLIGNVATDYGSFNIAVSTTNSDNPVNPKFTILKNGNVGINTTSPESGWKFDVAGIATMGSTAGNGRLYISCDNTTSGTTYIQARNLSVATPLYYTASKHTFDTNVGIGATSPTYPLTIEKSDEYSFSYQRPISTCKKWAIGSDNSSTYLRNITDSITAYTITNAGNLLVGTATDNGAKLNVSGSGKVAAFGLVGSGNDNYISFVGTSNTFDVGVTNGKFGIADSGVAYRFTMTQLGAATFTNSVTATGFFNSSDIRLKDVTDYDYNVSEIKPMNYYWKDKRDDKKHIGYSAQEVQKVMPDAVNEDEDGMLSVNYIEVLVAKIAQMEKEIELLKSK